MKSILEIDKPRFGVIGGGSWAIALAKLLSANGNKVSWYLRDINNINYIKENGRHRLYLQVVDLDYSLFEMSDDINKVVEESDVILMVIPSAYFLEELKKCTVSLENKIILSGVKGFVSEDNLTITELFNRHYNIPYENLGVLSGPCHAEELSMGRLSYLTITSKYSEVSEHISNFFKNRALRTIIGTDIYGVEYAANMKNIYAIAVGIASGLGFGDNFIAVLVTNAYVEMKNFLNASYPDKNRNTCLSAYMGDLLVTTYSQFSRNRGLGKMVGKGYSITSALLEIKQTAEGYYATKAIKKINEKYQVDIPIVDAVYSILYENKNPFLMIRSLGEKLQ